MLSFAINQMMSEYLLSSILQFNITVQLFRLLFFKLNFQIGNADESCERGCRLFLLIDGVAKTEDQTEQDTLKSCKHSKLSFLSLVFYCLFLSLSVYRFYSFFLSFSLNIAFILPLPPPLSFSLSFL